MFPSPENGDSESIWETEAKNNLFKNIKYESTQEINLFFYSYSRVLRSPRCGDTGKFPQTVENFSVIGIADFYEDL